MNHFAITTADLIEDVKSSKQLLDACTYELPNTYLNYLSGVYIEARNALVVAIIEYPGRVLTADQWSDLADLGFRLSPVDLGSAS